MAEQKMKSETAENERKVIGFLRLALEALPEIWSVRFIVQIMLFGTSFLFTRLLMLLIHSRGAAVTTGNLKSMLFSWQGPVLILIGITFALLSVAIDLFLQVQFCGDILQNKKAGFFPNLRDCILNIRKFLTPGGISILLYVLMGVPLAGIGFSVELTKDFRLPNFVMDVVYKRPALSFLFFGGTLLLLFLGFVYIFSVHGVLISGKTPKEAKRYSVLLIKKNWLKFVLMMLLVFAVTVLIRTGVERLIHLGLDHAMEQAEQQLSEELIVTELGKKPPESISEEDLEVIGDRIGYTAFVLMGTFVDFFLLILSRSFVLLFFTKLYLDFDRKEQGEEAPVYLTRAHGPVYFSKVALVVLVFILVALFSVLVGLFYDVIMAKRDIKIYAHRACGDLGFENSVEGLSLALKHGCAGGEIDIQRTMDGEYIVFHDTNFNRLAGVKKKPSQMTLEEIKALKLKDENGESHSVPMLEDFLDAAKKEGAVLLIELKGESADRRMVDDVVKMVREKDALKNVALISLKYDVIQYAENTYPEFETCALFFWGVGDFGEMDCDDVGLEELIASEPLFTLTHQKDKKVSVWTPNTEESLRYLLDSDVDMITTDSVELAEEIKKELSERSVRETLKDRLEDFWEN